MNKFSQILFKLLLTVPIVMGMVLVTFPFIGIQADDEVPSELSMCLDPVGPRGDLYKADGRLCPDRHEIRDAFPDDARGVCLFKDSNTNKWEVAPPEKVDADYQITPNGDKCIYSDVDPKDYPDFVPYSAIPQYEEPDDNPPSNNGNTGNTNHSNNTNTGGNTNHGSGNSNSVKYNQGDCEDGFHKVGPLCVPDSPFTDADAPVNSPDVGGLAIKFIKILLYFAGIVAVIMALIGGYQVMAARGNDAQVTNGRKTLTNAIIGLIIVVLSYAIIQAVVTFVTKS